MKLFEVIAKTNQELKFNNSIFNFGSMRDLNIFSAVLGRTISSTNVEEAYIKGYKAVNVENELFPAMIQDNISITDGILVQNLSIEDIKRIDYYEDGLYGTIILPVYTKRGDREEYTNIYLIRHSKLKPNLDEEWNFKNYQKYDVKDYLKQVKKWMKEYNNDES